MAAAKRSNSETDRELLSAMRADDKGWNTALFNDQNKASLCKCDHCKSVCCDAVELGCDHDDDDVFMYCEECLLQLIEHNHGKCPIDSHENPEIDPNKAMRRKILKFAVVCPYSTEYKLRSKQFAAPKAAAAANGNVVDTLDGNDEEKEGNEVAAIARVAADYKEEKQNEEEEEQLSKAGCKWQGTLKELMNTHLSECARRNDPTFVYRAEIKRLKTRIEELQNEINEQAKKGAADNEENAKRDEELKRLRAEVRALRAEKRELQQQLETQKRTISEMTARYDAVQHEMYAMKADLQDKDQNIQSLKLQIQHKEKTERENAALRRELATQKRKAVEMQQEVNAMKSELQRKHRNLKAVTNEKKQEQKQDLMHHDQWDENCKGPQVVLNGNTVRNTGFSWRSIYMKQVLSLPKKYQWKFRIEQLNYCLIGIFNFGSGAPEVNSNFNDRKDRGYGFYPHNGKLMVPDQASTSGKRYGVQCKSGDVIEMHLDLNQCKLSYSINGKHYGVAFNVQRTQYRAVLSFDQGSISYEPL